ncbi:protein diaphanous homolog 3 [Arapaima gigas]
MATKAKPKNDETGVMDSLLEALQSGAAFRERRKRVPRPRDARQSFSPSSQRPVLKSYNYGKIIAHSMFSYITHV